MRKFLAYALTDGAFGPAEFPVWTSGYVCWSYYGYYKGDSTDAWMARMVKCLKRVPVERSIYLGLFGNLPQNITSAAIRRVLKALKPYWDRVLCVDLADEPQWSRQECKANLQKVRDIMAELKLADRPLGITLTGDQSLRGDLVTIASSKLNFVTLEAYNDHKNAAQGPAVDIPFIQRNIKAAVARADSKMRFWFWGQAWGRNGAMPSEKDLAALQWPIYQLVKGIPRAEGILWFNWGRRLVSPDKGGSKWLPLVQGEHRRIAKDVGVLA